VSAADKLGSAAPYVIAPLAELTYLVTEAGASPQQIDGFRSAGTEVILA
jgi:DeoR/GlpR family transcriptional regulator of sugar metabolism